MSRPTVVIVGAGMVGATLACLLGRAGIAVTLIESTPPEADWPPDSVDLRVSAITAASEKIFTGLGAWTEMAALGVSPFRDVRVWDAAGSGQVHFDCAELGEPRLGHIVENRVIQRALMERVRALPEVQLLCPAELAALQSREDVTLVELSDGTRLSASLVVAADGAGSRTRSLAGIGVRGWSYQQKAVVAVVATERSHEATAWQRFLPDGVLAFLPLRDGRSSIVWSTSPARADELVAMADEAFTAELGQAFDHRLGRVSAGGPRAAFPLRLQHAEHYIGERLALVGDAAHAIHPLAGQGVNLGLLDAAALAEEVIGAAARGRNPGARTPLRRYERRRKGDNLLMMATMDGFKRLFASERVPLRLARNAGLSLFDAVTPLKRLVMQRAMGLTGDLPAIARGAHI